MLSHDLPAFTDTFDGLARMLLTRRLDDAERGRMLADYFKALRSYPLEAVQAGAEVVAQRSKHFPKPVEWVDAMPRQDETRHIPTMTSAEAAEWRAAERLFWEGEPCGCAACVRASVDWKPIRFVPEIDASGRDRHVRMPDSPRVVTAGHWAHGAELAGYYRAKGAFYTKIADLGFKPDRVARELTLVPDR